MRQVPQEMASRLADGSRLGESRGKRETRMWLLSKARSMVILGVSLVMVIVGGCTSQGPGRSHTGGKVEKADDHAICQESPPLSVEVALSGITTGRVKVNLQNGSIYAEGTEVSLNGQRSFQAKITQAESDRLRKLICDSALSEFHPKEDEWFHNYREIDGSAVLRVVWREKARGFLVPPEGWRTHLPEEAYRRYRWMDGVVGEVMMLQARYVDKGHS